MASVMKDSTAAPSDQNAVSNLLEKKAETLDQLRATFLSQPSEPTEDFRGSYLSYIKAKYAVGTLTNTNESAQDAALMSDWMKDFEESRQNFLVSNETNPANRRNDEDQRDIVEDDDGMQNIKLPSQIISGGDFTNANDVQVDNFVSDSSEEENNYDLGAYVPSASYPPSSKCDRITAAIVSTTTEAVACSRTEEDTLTSEFVIDEEEEEEQGSSLFLSRSRRICENVMNNMNTNHRDCFEVDDASADDDVINSRVNNNENNYENNAKHPVSNQSERRRENRGANNTGKSASFQLPLENMNLRIIDPEHSIRTPADAFLEYYMNNLSHNKPTTGTERLTKSGDVDQEDGRGGRDEEIEDLDCDIEDFSDFDQKCGIEEDTDSDCEIGALDCIVEDLL